MSHPDLSGEDELI